MDLEFYSNSIEEKLDANWWRRYSKFAHEHRVENKNTHTQIHASLFENGVTKFQTRIW